MSKNLLVYVAAPTVKLCSTKLIERKSKPINTTNSLKENELYY